MTATGSRRGRAKASARALNARQLRFVEEYLVDLNATQAAARAGYSAKTAEQIGYQLLQHSSVSAKIKELQQVRSERTAITADYVLRTIHETVERCRQAEPVRDSRGRMIEGVFVFDAKGVLRGCELLGKHLGVFNEGPQQPATRTIRRTIVHSTRAEGGGDG